MLLLGVPGPSPSHPFLIGIPQSERQKHNQKCSRKKKKKMQWFLANFFG